MIKLTKRTAFLFGSVIVLLLSAIVLLTLPFMPNITMEHGAEMHSTEYNKEIVAEEHEGIRHLLAEGRYKCCMKEPCFRCFSKSANHDKDLVCDCLVDVYNGKHPCGECIGEILEGEGNPLMAEYFATAIAEKFGVQHLVTLKQIITEKYDMSINRQI